MTLKIPVQSVIVLRKGERVVAPVNAPFNFTDDEIEQIEESSPGALLPVNVREAEKIVQAAKGDVDGDGGDDAGKHRPRQRGGRAKQADDDDTSDL